MDASKAPLATGTELEASADVAGGQPPQQRVHRKTNDEVADPVAIQTSAGATMRDLEEPARGPRVRVQGARRSSPRQTSSWTAVGPDSVRTDGCSDGEVLIAVAVDVSESRDREFQDRRKRFRAAARAGSG